jgi:hypothetical protein
MEKAIEEQNKAEKKNDPDAFWKGETS